MPLTHFGFLGSSVTTGDLGGRTVRLTVASTLLIGDAVYISAASTAAKSVTAGDRLKRIGIVVGGSSFGANATIATSSDVGKTAAVSGGWVIVCISGVTYGVVGAVAVTFNAPLKFDAATSGRLIPATPATDAGMVVAIALESVSTAGGAVKVVVALH